MCELLCTQYALRKKWCVSAVSNRRMGRLLFASAFAHVHLENLKERHSGQDFSLNSDGSKQPCIFFLPSQPPWASSSCLLRFHMLVNCCHAPLTTLLFELGPPCDHFQGSTEGFRQGSCNQVNYESLTLASGQNTNETLILDSSGAPFPCLSSPSVPVRQGGY